MLIFLIGFMGSGKSTAAKLIAESIGYEFADLDILIEQKEGMPITEIFAGKGEEYFRELESETLESLLKRQKFVVACGGGTACFHGNMQKMKSAGITVYLKVSPELLAVRLSSGHPTRPLVAGMQGRDLKDHIRKLLAGREGWYKQSDIVYNADNFNLQELTNLIRSRIASRD